MTTDIYFDGFAYDQLGLAASHEAEVAFYSELAREAPGGVLELGCGTGRVTLPLAAVNADVVGLDRSPIMLARAQEKERERTSAQATAGAGATAVTWVAGDARDFELGRRFDLIIFPNNAICHLHERAEIRACLRRVWAHLTPEGRFVVETFNPSLALLTRGGESHPVAEYRDREGERIVVTETARYDAATQIEHITWRYRQDDGVEVERTLDLRMFFPQEFLGLLEANGFVVEAALGDFAGAHFSSAARRHIVICRRGGD